MSTMPWRRAWKPRGEFATLSPCCRGWYHALIAELVDDDGTITLRGDRELAAELALRMGAPPGERRLIARYLDELITRGFLIVHEGLVEVAHWSELQGSGRKRTRNESRTSRARTDHEPATTRERTDNEPITNRERTENEISVKPSESLDTGSEKRKEESRIEEKRAAAAQQPRAPDPLPDVEELSGARLRRQLAAAVSRAWGSEPVLEGRAATLARDLVAKHPRAMLEREIAAYERWLRAVPEADRHFDVWLRFLDHLGSWPSKASAPRRPRASRASRVGPADAAPHDAFDSDGARQLAQLTATLEAT